jgi:hypothetical protein
MNNNNEGLRDTSDWSRMSYSQAVRWMIQDKDTAWVQTGKPSAKAIVIADLFHKSFEDLRADLKAALR